MNIPPVTQGIGKMIVVAVTFISLIFCGVLYGYVLFSDKTTGDFALTDKQVLDKAQLCHKVGMAIQLVYDDEWQVYAVKYVESGFTGDGRRK